MTGKQPSTPSPTKRTSKQMDSKKLKAYFMGDGVPQNEVGEVQPAPKQQGELPRPTWLP